MPCRKGRSEPRKCLHPLSAFRPHLLFSACFSQALDNKSGHSLDMAGIAELAANKRLLLLSDTADSAGSNRKAMMAGASAQPDLDH